MNWLAHVLLSEPTPAFQLGNLLPDFARAADLAHLSGELRRGMECHRRIDAFTDRNEVVSRSKRRITADYRRYSGILVDIFYDHILTREWSRYAPGSVAELTESVYGAIDASGSEIPCLARERLQMMRKEDWLGGYGDIAGIELVLTRLGTRLKHPVELRGAIVALKTQYQGFSDDFRAFFPMVREHLRFTPGF